MDISVSRLNNRMVLQVPPELPLGLVFVVGQVHNLTESRENGHPMQFDLVESGYRLRCQLSSRVANDVFLQEGDMVRAGGHLAFDTQAARYFLLARDLEIVPEITPGTRTKMASILQDVKKRAEAADLVRTELPQWVKQLAPPEVQEELGLIEGQEEEDMVPAGADTLEPGTDLLAPVVDMSDEMLAFLSEAIDRNEDVEITPEVLAQFLPLERQQGGEISAPADPEYAEPLPPPPPRPAEPAADQPSTTRPAAPQPATVQPQTRPASPPTPPPAQPQRRSSNTVQNLLLVVIGVLLLLLVIVISLIALNYLQII